MDLKNSQKQTNPARNNRNVVIAYHLVKPIEFVIGKPGQGDHHDQHNNYDQEIFRSWNLFFYIVFIFVHIGLFNFQLDFAKPNAITGTTVAKGPKRCPISPLGKFMINARYPGNEKPFQNERVVFQNEKLFVISEYDILPFSCIAL